VATLLHSGSTKSTRTASRFSTISTWRSVDGSGHAAATSTADATAYRHYLDATVNARVVHGSIFLTRDPTRPVRFPTRPEPPISGKLSTQSDFKHFLMSFVYWSCHLFYCKGCMRAKYCDEYICFCLSVHISQIPRSRTSEIFCACRSLTALRYVILPV